MTQTLPPVLETKLADFRRRVWVVKLAEGLLAALFGFAVSYLLVFALDRVCETPGWLRGLILFAAVAGLGLGLPLKWHRWVWQQRRLEDAARLLRRKLPRLGDQLLGIVELARHAEGSEGRSERLVAAAMAQAVEAVKDQDFSRAVPHARHRQWGLAAAGGLAVAVLALFLVNGAARNALARWLTPWLEIERYTFARVQPLQERLVVPYAEPFDLPVKLTADTEWSPAEGQARIGRQPSVHAALAAGAYPLTFPPQKADAPLKLSLGDVRKTLLVEPRPRPELGELTVHLHLPAYLGYQTEPRLEVHGGSVSILKGADASFEARASRPLAHAQVDGVEQKVTGETIRTSYQPVSESAERRFTWEDLDGLVPRDPLILKVRAVADEAPTVVARRDSLEQVVLDSEVVTFDLVAADDFGVKRVGLEWVGSRKQEDGKTPATGDKLTAAGAPETREVKSRATFQATREGVAPQTIEIRGWSEDYLPGRPRAHSATFVLHILNKTDHALWLTDQFGKWLETAKESYEREQQLHQENKDLRGLTATELDRPENRRRVSQQAAAENANAARLDNLNALGKNLVEQATKNDEFEADRLESWAKTLEALQDIAAQRMPSVSDLLKQTANSAGKNGSPSAAGKPGEPGQPTAAKPAQGQPGATAPPGSAIAGEPKAGAASQPGETNPGEENLPGKDSPSNDGNTAQGTPRSPTEAKPGESQPSAPSLAHGDTPPPGGAKPPGPSADPTKPSAPSIADREGGLGPKTASKPAAGGPASPAGAGKLSLPTTTLAGGPAKKPGAPDDDPAPPAESPAQEKLDDALNEQKDLLAEFARVSDELGDILANLEASTFVKRFKAASRQQMNIASRISQKTLDAFGIEREPVKAAAPIVSHARDQGEVVRTIQADLDAYSQRKQEAPFQKILDEMKKTEVVRALVQDGDRLALNLAGQSLTGSEFWADTLDRWGEELVEAAKSGGKPPPGQSQEQPSLPPEIVLKVMQALRDEMSLREETRETEAARPELDEEKYLSESSHLGEKQGSNQTLTKSAVDDIRALPEGERNFAKELQLLTAVATVMEETKRILYGPETGPKAIAAETEAIELLLQAKRQSQDGGGGGGGSTAGGGGTATSARRSALSGLGPGGAVNSSVQARPVGQATGRAGKEFPEEFKPGLEAYFNLLEKQPAQK